MFEVGFTEIILILGLALLVLGPEKLPALAEKVGRWTGRARAMARQLRTQLEQEVNLEEMAKSRPMQAPPPPSPAPEPAAAATSSTPYPHGYDGSSQPQGQPEAATPDNGHNVSGAQSTSEPAATHDRPHSASPGLDVDTMVSGIEPPPRPTSAPAQDSAVTRQ
jgi:Tat protein translocase TatB subunit